MYLKTTNYGWLPDLPDHRDFLYSAIAKPSGKLPPNVDLRTKMPAIYDQGQLGSCTANAISGAFEFELLKQNAPDFMPSRLFIYYNERAIENTVNTDSGAQIRDGIKSVATQGVCPEAMWPYIISEFTQKPQSNCYEDALNHLVTSYHRLTQDVNQLKSCLAEGYPFVFGFTVYDSFESQQVAQSGVLNLPAPGEKAIGGHAVMAVGYDDKSQRFIIRNSWGTDWGQQGYFTMPYAYLTNTNLADDFWTIRLIMANAALKKPAKKKQISKLQP
jgi:C1A family cysteine protease